MIVLKLRAGQYRRYQQLLQNIVVLPPAKDYERISVPAVDQTRFELSPCW